MGCTTEPEDCTGVAGGSAVVDECGVCDSNASNDCQDCSTHFDYFSTIKESFYYFKNVTINGVNISAEDSVAAFKGEICVGSQIWNTVKCGGGICDLPVNGYDGNFPEETAGYMLPGDVPTFKIYDVTNNLFYNATTSKAINPWGNLSIDVIDTLIADILSATPCKE